MASGKLTQRTPTQLLSVRGDYLQIKAADSSEILLASSTSYINWVYQG